MNKAFESLPHIAELISKYGIKFSVKDNNYYGSRMPIDVLAYVRGAWWGYRQCQAQKGLVLMDEKDYQTLVDTVDLLEGVAKDCRNITNRVQEIQELTNE
ncbi:hypothetical protein [Acinetobacter variabilis]|uniref:Uncharacterized protein n=1 Tax=Acinetobacter variabilis TaxID=70346 RepID=N8VKF2_9GAMM|nr:hypothetical protein [Acinetobacter variabilis]ENV00397.1 hypothetical protein F969_00629 [Acinetobacter variabilis]